jgi:site-specific DNA recombinase
VDHTELTARELLRVSKDKSGRERSNERQQDDNHTVWGFQFAGDPYREVGSASRFSRKERDEFPLLIGDLETGRFGADVLAMWEGSRGSRKVGEWVTLIDACVAARVLIAITEHERIYDPRKARDRKDLIAIANDAEFEAGQMSGRIRSDAAKVAAAGTPIGPAPLGYRRIYHPETKEFVRLEPHPDEAPIVRDLFSMLEEGHSARDIAAAFATRGWTSRRGNALPPSELTRIAKRVAYIGQRAHLSVDDWRTLTPAERLQRQTTVEAWEPLVSERQFWAVQRIIRAPERLTSTRPFRATHTYTGTLTCGGCGDPMSVALYRHPDGHYYCPKNGCCMIYKPPVDVILDAAVVGYLSRPENIARTTSDDDETVNTARAEVERCRAQLDDLYATVASGNASASMQAATEKALLARLQAAETQVVQLLTPSELRGFAGPGVDVAQLWETMPVPAKRRTAKLLLSPVVLGEARIMPNPKGNGQVRLPVEERLVWVVECPDCGFQGSHAELDEHTH